MNPEEKDQEGSWEKKGKDHTLKQLHDLTPEAVATLRKVMKEGPPREARQAAETLLSRVGFPEERKGEIPLIQYNTLVSPSISSVTPPQ